MPVYEQTQTGATQFDASTEALGLFTPLVYGGGETQCRINGIFYHGTGTAPILTVTLASPTVGNDILLFTATTNDYAVMTPFLIPTAADGSAWVIELTTTNKDATAWWTIDWDAVPTGG